MRNKLQTFPMMVALCVLLGVGLRLGLVVASGWRIDYDEGMIGLMGLRVLHGEFMAFVPARPTIGALEAYLLAPLFAVFGANVVTFRLVGLAFSTGYIVTTALLSRAAFDARAGVIAALLAAVAPPYMVVVGLKTWGGTIETIVLGNVLFLLTFYVIERAETDVQRRKGMFGTGLVAGVMFWLLFLGVYYFIPVALILLWRGRRALWVGWWAGLLGFVVGSLPFWVFNLNESFATFSGAVSEDAMTVTDMRAIVAHFRVDLVPRLVSADPAWGGAGWLRMVAVLVYSAGVVWLVSRLRKMQTVTWLLVGLLVCVPTVYVVSGYGLNALNPWGIDATGRYVLMLHTALPIGVAGLSAWLMQRGRVIKVMGAGLVAATVTLNLLGLLLLDPVRAFDSPYYDRLPEDFSPLLDYLDEEGITHVWTDVGIAQVLMFVTEERIVAADYYDAEIAGGLVRFPDALDALANADRTAYVVPVLSGQTDLPFQRTLDELNIAYTRVDVTPTLAVYTMSRPIHPSELAAGLGYQY